MDTEMIEEFLFRVSQHEGLEGVFKDLFTCPTLTSTTVTIEERPAGVATLGNDQLRASEPVQFYRLALTFEFVEVSGDDL